MHAMDWSQFNKFHSDLNASVEELKGLNEGARDAVALGKLRDTLSSLQALVVEPSGFIHRLAIQTQLLACIKWLGEFQVTPCIPRDSSIPMQELADLADVPNAVLSRIVRMTATAGFLREPEPGLVAHTPLSEAFCSQLTYSDAATFLSDVIAPTSLRLSSATAVCERGTHQDDLKNGFAISPELGRPFPWACAEDPKLRRQWSAYSRTMSQTAEGDEFSFLFEYLKRLTESDSVVYICDRLTESSRAFLEAAGPRHFIVQTYDLAPGDVYAEQAAKNGLHDLTQHKFAVQKRDPKSPQLVKEAALYILQPCLPSVIPHGMNLSAVLAADLQAHLSVLRANPSASLVFVPRLLPESGTTPINLEAQQRLNDLTNMELGYESMLEVREAIELVESIHDEQGKLIVTNHLRGGNGATAGFEVALREVDQHGDRSIAFPA